MSWTLPTMRIEMKLFTSATMLFAALGILMAVAYVYFSHRSPTGAIPITPADIAATYYGPGVGIATLVDIAHIHLLGLLSIFWVIGYIFQHSSFATVWRIIWPVAPFVAFPVDVAGWFLTRLSPELVYIVILGGAAFIVSLTAMILMSLYDMWLTPYFHPERALAPDNA